MPQLISVFLMAHEIFISYAAEDKPIADAVCAAIEGHGIRCWYAPRDVEYGKDFEESIVDAIAASRLVILILTSHANDSAHVKREIQNASMEEVAVPVLPFRTEDIPLNKSLRYYIGSVHWLDALTPPLEPHLQRLVEHVKARAGKSPTESKPQLEPETDRSSSPSSTDEPEQAQSHEPEIIAESTFEEAPAPFLEPEFEAEESPSATRSPNLKTLVRASAILLLVVIGGIALLVGISSFLTSRSREPANPSANSDAAKNPGALAGLEVRVFFNALRKDEANRIAERLRRYGAQVALTERSDDNRSFEGLIHYYEGQGRAEEAKRIADAVSDIESFTLSAGSARSSTGAQFFIWVKTYR